MLILSKLTRTLFATYFRPSTIQSGIWESLAIYKVIMMNNLRLSVIMTIRWWPIKSSWQPFVVTANVTHNAVTQIDKACPSCPKKQAPPPIKGRQEIKMVNNYQVRTLSKEDLHFISITLLKKSFKPNSTSVMASFCEISK